MRFPVLHFASAGAESGMNCVNHPTEDAPYQCSRCRAPICVDCETKVGGLSICLTCLNLSRERLAARYEAETRQVNYGGAIFAGLLAALVLAFIWSQIVVSLGYRAGAVATAMGGVVGYAVMSGAGGKRGRTLQQAASILTVTGFVCAHFLILLRTQEYAGLGLQGTGSALVAALYAFPSRLSSLKPLDGLFLVLGTIWAYWVPHVRQLRGWERGPGAT